MAWPKKKQGWAVSRPVPSIHTDPWDNAGFEVTRRLKPGYAELDAEWADERSYCYPVDVQDGLRVSQSWRRFVDSTLLPRLAAVLQPPSSSVFAAGRRSLSHDAASAKVCGKFEVGFDRTDGSIVKLVDVDTNTNWASEQKPLAQLRYLTLNRNGKAELVDWA